jgi:hypothetical protein
MPCRYWARTSRSTTAIRRSTSAFEEAAGEGIDVFFDNVGGNQLTLALSVMNNHASVVLCGWVSSYARPDDPTLAPTSAPQCSSGSPCGVHRQRLLPRAVASDPHGAGGAAANEAAEGGGQRLVGLERAPEALATVFDRGSPCIGRRVVRISAG